MYTQTHTYIYIPCGCRKKASTIGIPSAAGATRRNELQRRIHIYIYIYICIYVYINSCIYVTLWMQKDGVNHRNPISGGREHEETNLSVAARRDASYDSTTSQNQRITGVSAW